MKITKRIVALLMLVAMLSALVACGGGGALTEDEYADAIQKLQDDVNEVGELMGSLDPTDMDGAMAALDDTKGILVEFTEIVPPEAYEKGHEKMKAGCEALVEFLDGIGDLADEDEAGQMAALEELLPLMQTAQTDMTEGAQLLQDAGLDMSAFF